MVIFFEKSGPGKIYPGFNKFILRRDVHHKMGIEFGTETHILG